MSSQGSTADRPAKGIGAPVVRPKVHEAVAEDLYLAAAATRLTLKNRILVETLAQGEDFDTERFVAEAREMLLELADESDQEAERVREESRGAWRRFRKKGGAHDYRAHDIGNLRRRRAQAQRTAAELRERAGDDAELRELVETARDAAWEEVSRNIDRSLRISAARPDEDPDYESMREARMQALQLVDLPRLSAWQRKRTEPLGQE